MSCVSIFQQQKKYNRLAVPLGTPKLTSLEHTQYKDTESVRVYQNNNHKHKYNYNYNYKSLTT